MPDVKLLTRMAGPAGNYAEGTVLSLPGPEASALVKAGAAEWVGDPPAETAMTEPVAEKAVRLKRKRKPRAH